MSETVINLPAAVPHKREIQNVIDAVPILDTARFEHMQRIARVMASSSMIPETLRTVGPKENKEALPFEQVLSNCFLVVNQAARWGMDPFAVISCCSVVHGRLSYEGKLVSAVLDAKLGIELAHHFTGSPHGEDYRIYLSDQPFTDEIIAELKPGFSKNGWRIFDGSVAEWKTTGTGSPWSPKNYKRMLIYRGTRDWARIYKSALMLGVYSDDEMLDLMEDARARRATPILSLADRLAASTSPKNGDGFSHDHVTRETNGHAQDQQNTGAQREAGTKPSPPASAADEAGDETKLTVERLRELLSYDGDDGTFRWRETRGPNAAGDVAGSPSSEGYVRITIDGRSYRAHRLAWFYVHGEWPNGQLDHQNRDRKSNGLTNLRVATPAQNNANRILPSGVSGYRGVNFDAETQKWRAEISIENKNIKLGRFDAVEDAARAYDKAAREHQGEFAVTNFSDEESTSPSISDSSQTLASPGTSETDAPAADHSPLPPAAGQQSQESSRAEHAGDEGGQAQAGASPSGLPAGWEITYAAALRRAQKIESLPKYAADFWKQYGGWEKIKATDARETAAAVYDAFNNNFGRKDQIEAALRELI